MSDILHVFSSISVHMVVWEAFLFFLTHHHLVHVHSFHQQLSHHHSSQFFFLSCRWWCRKFFFFFFFFPHTTICMCHPISLIIIHHNFHPIVRCSFMHTKLSVPICKGVRFTEHQPSPVLSKNWFHYWLLHLCHPFSLHMPLIATFLSPFREG